MESRLKIGNNVLCKKDVIDKNMVHFHKGDYYRITFANSLWVRISSFYNEDYAFSVSPYSSSSPIMFEDYFYTLKETRKLKLDSLK